MEWVLGIAGGVILAAYFVRRMVWLSEANRNNLLTGDEEGAAEAEKKSTDLLSWVLLVSGIGLLLWSLSCQGVA